MAIVREWYLRLRERIAAAQKVVAYQQSLELLRTSDSFEEIARRRHELTTEIAENSGRLWRDWVQLAPSRLTSQQRKDVADFAALLQVIIGRTVTE